MSPTDPIPLRRRRFLWRGFAGASLGPLLAGCADEAIDPTTPTPSPTPTPRPMVPFEASHSEVIPEVRPVERRLFELTNGTRRNHDLNPLVYRLDLAYVARWHCKNMAEQGFYAHRDLQNRKASDRLMEFGLTYEGVGENLMRSQNVKNGLITNEAKLAEHLFTAWKGSQPHRWTILNEDMSYTGVGVYISKEEMVYAAQLFAIDERPSR